MDYKNAWEDVKNYLEMALDEGEDRGFDTNNKQVEKEHAMYRAYKNVYDKMKRLESKDN